MYQINLSPNQPKRRRERGLPALPALPALKLGGGSKWGAVALAVWILAPALVGWVHVSDGRAQADLNDAIEVAREDSVRYAAIHEANAALRAREDTIRRKLDVIAGLDGGRFVWAHIVDELSRVLPQYVWLTEVVFLSDDSPLDEPRFAVLGRSGTTFALTDLLQGMEASPFLRDITLVQTSQVVEPDGRTYSFAIEARYRAPGWELLDLDPVFAVGGN